MRVALSALLTAGIMLVVVTTYQASNESLSYTLLVSSGALICSALLTLSHFRRRQVVEGENSLFSSMLPLGALRLGLFGVIWLAYVIILPLWGFLLPSWLALFLSLSVVRGRPSLVGALATAAFVLVFSILINAVLYVPVPQGLLDQQLDELLYSIL